VPGWGFLSAVAGQPVDLPRRVGRAVGFGDGPARRPAVCSLLPGPRSTAVSLLSRVGIPLTRRYADCFHFTAA